MMRKFRSHPTEKVSRRMSAIRSRGNATTELKMMRILRAQGLSGWRRHASILGKPDFCWSNEKVALFVDGCFWHGCPRCRKIPRNYGSYWPARIATNKRRDEVVTKQLRREGWRVVRVWECRVSAEGSLSRITRALGRHQKKRSKTGGRRRPKKRGRQ